MWKDGDEIITDTVGWPKDKTWWKNDTMKKKVNDANAAEIFNYLTVNPESVVAFNQHFTKDQVVMLRKLGHEMAVFSPSQETIILNRDRRKIEQPDRYVQTDDELARNRQHVADLAVDNSLFVFQSSDELLAFIKMRAEVIRQNHMKIALITGKAVN